MSSEKLPPDGGTTPSSHHGNQSNNRIAMFLSGMATLVSVFAMLVMVREVAYLREQQMAFMKDMRHQQEEFQRNIQEQVAYLREQGLLSNPPPSPEGPLPGEVGSKQDWQRDNNPTLRKREGAHHRSKRNAMANTVLVHRNLGESMLLPVVDGQVGSFGISGPPGPPGTPGLPGPPGECTCPRLTTATPSTAAPRNLYASRPPVESDCAGYYSSGQAASGVYPLFLSSSSVEAYCDMDTAGGGWTIIQRRQDGSVLFDRTWEEYKLGFGNKSGEYWLGNENIHLLTIRKNYKLRIEMQDWEGNQRYAEYSNFRLSGESDGYRLSVSGYTGNVPDPLSYHNGQRFSTRDRDNDAISGLHCSQRYGQGGWWFLACMKSCLNGHYLGNCGASCPYSQGVVWYGWRGRWYSMKAVSMKIKP